ncbi:MAG: membrane protein insertion efficiency factor YidD [Rhizobiales bacterium 63-7]|nr:membrane protein insertion efficiency factor YidD [Hyphomicrobiales bacterium]OJU72039.1 MAG: membrane protein insertion efficiency factor YidD [Rhizobiales bacterium 63-7]
MCQFCLMQDDDEDEGGAAAGPIAKPVKPSRNYGGPFRKTPGRLLGMGFIRLYQLTLSSLIGNSCRHLPTCSEYGYEAIARHGFWSGGWMTLFRVARCGPGGSSGFDPVPETLEPTIRWWAPWRHWSRRTVDAA